MLTLPTLYKKTTTGAIQQWAITVEEDKKALAGVIVTRYGQVDGAIQETTDIVSEGKNAGRSNATTAYQQACAEAKSKWEGKKKKGYVEQIDSAEKGHTDDIITGGVFPMLAQKFVDHGEKIKYPAYIQRKYDGVRCIACIVNGKATLWTRTRKPITSMPNIISALEKHFKGGTVTLDGELYNPALEFEKLVSLVRPSSPRPDHWDVSYYIYDMVSGLGYSQRLTMLIGAMPRITGPLIPVETIEVFSPEEVILYTEKFQSENYEGSIVRNSDTVYEIGKRSYGLQKVKDHLDSEYEVVKVNEGRGRMAGCAVFDCKTAEGKVFSVKMRGTLDSLRAYVENPKLAVGKMLTVRYQNLTSDGIPRFPVGVSLRDYE